MSPLLSQLDAKKDSSPPDSAQSVLRSSHPSWVLVTL